MATGHDVLVIYLAAALAFLTGVIFGFFLGFLAFAPDKEDV